MMSMLKCLSKAHQCELMAATCDKADRRALLETAKHWRTLAAVAQAAETGHLRGLPTPRPPDQTDATADD